ncbi:MAG: Zn-dependent alcohol dehydrogenase [Halobacteria archaeon]
MKTRAAVLLKPRQMAVEEVEIADPKAGEVRVKVAAVGVCATDLHRYAGESAAPLPVVLGHEGAGVVESVGPGVAHVRPGDRVVLSVLPSCGTCKPCLEDRPYLCAPGWFTLGSGAMLDNTRRLQRAGGGKLYHLLGQSSFAEHAVVCARSTVKIPDDVPLDTAALLGCGATTGFGAVLTAPGFAPGCSVAIFGCGGVGTSGLMAAKAGGASTIIAVDVADSKLENARRFGATHTFNSKERSPLPKIRELTGGLGVDFGFEFVGRPETIAAAAEATRLGGVATFTGEPRAGDRVAFTPFTFYGRTLRGNMVGYVRPQVDIPRYAAMVRQGLLPLDRLVTRTYRLEEVEKALQDLERGENVRGLIRVSGG